MSGKGGLPNGLKRATAAMLQSPNFLYRAELGDQPDGKGGLRLSSHEMAARLSYFLWNSTPDETLLKAAAEDRLQDPKDVRLHAQRLLESPRAKEGVANFAAELFGVDHLEGIAKDAALFPTLTPPLREAMRQELLLLFSSTALDPEMALMDLFTTRKTFVNSELAKHYGASVSGSGFAPWTHPESSPRAGILGTGAFLTMWGKQHETSPTLRGKFIRTRLLCEDIPSPPPGVSTVLPEPPEGKMVSRRDLLVLHMTEPSCSGCHNLMDPLGFGLEHFDPIGRHRTMDRGLPIDATGDLDGGKFSNGKELGALLRHNASAQACMVRNLHRYATGRVEADAQEIALVDLIQRFRSRSGSFRELVLDLVTSPSFTTVSAARSGL